jgi:hypothetical protein
LIALSVEGGHISPVYSHWEINSTLAKRYTVKTASHGIDGSLGVLAAFTIDQDCSLHIAKFNIVSAAALHTLLLQRVNRVAVGQCPTSSSPLGKRQAATNSSRKYPICAIGPPKLLSQSF